MSAGNLQRIGDRLREERVRLDLSQVAFADACGVNRGTVAAWEKGEQTPTAAVLAVMEGLGLDVLYVIAGRRTPAAADLDKREETLLNNYRATDEKGRRVIESTAHLASERQRA